MEIKQTAHRIDGVFLPPNDRPDLPIYFALNELQDSEDLPLSLELLRLVVAPQKQAPQLAKRILATPSFSQNLSVESTQSPGGNDRS